MQAVTLFLMIVCKWWKSVLFLYVSKLQKLYVRANSCPKSSPVFQIFKSLFPPSVSCHSFAYDMKIILQKQLIHHRELHPLSGFIFVLLCCCCLVEFVWLSVCQEKWSAVQKNEALAVLNKHTVLERGQLTCNLANSSWQHGCPSASDEQKRS